MIKLLDVRYIGWVKIRPDGTHAANGWSNNAWSVLLLKSALYQYFGISERPGETATLYNALGVIQDSDDATIKAAYKRLAKQWHPDLCKERDARSQFEAIKSAYDVLSDATRRAKYNAGLMLQSTISNVHSKRGVPDESNPAQIYRSPLRCGYILADGHEGKGKFIVSEIKQWQDIKNVKGQTLVVSWKYGDDQYTEAWV